MMKVVYRDNSAASNIDAAYLAGLKGKTAKPEDIERFLRSQGEFRKNVITRKNEFKGNGETEYREVSDSLVNDFWRRMCSTCECKVVKDHVYNVINSSFCITYNPMTEYFENLPEWDGTDYIKGVAEMVDVEPVDGETKEEAQNWFELCLKKWLVAMVATVMKLKSVNHLFFILLGKQGIFKTTWLNMLLPPELQNYVDTKNDSSRLNKDDQINTTEKLIINLEEIDDLQQAQLNQLKALITQEYVTERAPYERFAEKRKKIASFCGSGNNRHILNDLTGNRRFLPFWVNGISNPRNYEYNYVGMYSQVMYLLDSGFEYWMNKDDMERQAKQQESFLQPSLEEELLLTYYRKPEGPEATKLVKASNILERINSCIKQPLSSKKLALILERIGFEKTRTRNGICYKVIEKSGSEINHGETAEEQYDFDKDAPF
jgi:predicted P-loop ATPase